MSRSTIVDIYRWLSCLTAAFMLSACDITSSELKKAEELVQNAPVEIISRHSVEERPFVYLIGESHVSVANQIELADLLRSLDLNAGIRTILVEGSNGAFPLESIREEIDLGTRDKANTYWREQLEWGRIAGYEFVALTTPGIAVHGVEDMINKTLYELKSNLHESSIMRLDIKSLRLGQKRLENGLKAIQGNADYSGKHFSEIVDLHKATSAYALSVDDYEQASRAYSNKMRRIYDRQVEFFSLYRKAIHIYDRYGPNLEEMEELRVELNSRSKRHSALVDDYRRKVDQYNRAITEQKESNSLLNLPNSFDEQQKRAIIKLLNKGKYEYPPSFLQPEVPSLTDLERLEAELEREEALLKSKKATYDTFKANEYPTIKVLNKFERELSKEEKAALESSVAALEEAEAGLQDSYSRAANRLQGVADPLGIDISSVQRFWLDRDQWISKQNLKSAPDELHDRDAAMAENTEIYLAEHNLESAALIVGYAHLPGMAKQLKERNLGFIGLRLKSTDAEIQSWEHQAWATRRAIHKRGIYTEKRLKEISPLLNPYWRVSENERIVLYGKLRGVDFNLKPPISGLIGNGLLYENVLGLDRVIVTSKIPFDRNAHAGDYILDRGVLPLGSGEYYQIIDRKRAIEDVQSLSNSSTAFAYAYQTMSSGASRYEIITPEGETNVATFREDPPRTLGDAVPERVVLFREPDEVEHDGVILSPLLDRMRKSEPKLATGGAGGIKPPVDSNNTVDGEGLSPEGPGKRQGSSGASSGGSGAPLGGSGGRYYWAHPWLAAGLVKGQRSPRLYQTINPKRAKRNLALLDRQRGRNLGEIEFIDEQGLGSLPFTPRDGSHARTVVFHAKNTKEFRRQLAESAAKGMLRNKQIALITCGDAFVETATLREELLDAGAIMVWLPERQLGVEQGRALFEHVKQVTNDLGPKGTTQSIDELMMRSLQDWQIKHPDDAAIRIFEQSGPWVFLQEPSDGMKRVL